MPDPIICLECGGAVEPPDPPDPDLAACTCKVEPAEAVRVLCPACGGPLRVGARACPYCASTLATCRCATCLAWNLAASRHCQACGRTLEDGGEAGGGTVADLSCPRCDARLHVRQYAELSADECDSCGGLFLSPAMMNRIVASHEKSVGLRLALPKRTMQRETAVRYIRCPFCRNSMNRRMFGRISGVIVDVCREHGVWFDAGELTEVLAFVERGGLDVARQRERAESDDEARRHRVEQAMSQRSHSLREAGLTNHSVGALEAGVAIDLIHALVELWK